MAKDSRSRWKSGPPRTRDQLQSYIPYLFNRLANRWNLDQNRDLSEHNINNVVFRTLSVLFIYKTLTVNEIAVLAVTEQSTASRMVESMVTSGLVKREIAEEDQRRRVVGLTAEGEALLRKIWPIMENNYERLTVGIDRRDRGLRPRAGQDGREHPPEPDLIRSDHGLRPARLVPPQT
ncbi:MarR family winged helix-turn-helix transcriptional regulator [Bradyrhizobium viridifuturi]|uniref:MarR family winged helix-turn-helix transcriptional regulator n=1 Tax=Bradyrhizobium viridifuturi TaxID=1654716 RepID=UPI000B014800|nr:MarR family winged helix-turn-helix transcriptional regulator [Bradyrhizobium viridifuturi]